ncbi:MAG: hypothetical protein C5B46_02845 [Proteobacteria bacterium]|nr:MAG: hypothetical protein C5B46_02845 [Pseudomonadota bacterium]
MTEIGLVLYLANSQSHEHTIAAKMLSPDFRQKHVVILSFPGRDPPAEADENRSWRSQAPGGSTENSPGEAQRNPGYLARNTRAPEGRSILVTPNDSTERKVAILSQSEVEGTCISRR